MSDIADDDLLNDDEEFDHEGYNLSDKEEDALLEGEDYDRGNHSREYINPSSAHSDKKQTHGDSDDLEDDILDLDVEEDFQDVDEKPSFEEKRPNEKRQERKFSNERPSTSSNTTTNKVPIRLQATKNKNVPAVKSQTENNKIIVQNSKKAPPKIERRKRGTGRGNFQSRANFNRSNSQKERRLERRNTVFINPKYEGIVHINENNARLAWDNSSHQQNNSHYIQPWAVGTVPGNSDGCLQDPSLLINSLVTEIANFSQAPANLFQVPAVQPSLTQNFFQPPEPAQLTFQISNREAFPPQTSHTPSYQSTGPSFNSQSLADRYQNDSNTYNSYGNYSYNRSNNQDYSLETKKNFTSSNYDNRNMNYDRTMVNKQNQYDTNKIDNYKTSFSSQDGYKNNFSNKDDYKNNFSNQDSYKNNFSHQDSYKNNFSHQDSYKNNFSNQDSYKNNFSNQDSYYKSNYSNQDNYQTRASNYLDDGFESRKPLYSKTSIYNNPTPTYETRNLYKTTDSKEIGYITSPNTAAFGNRNLAKNENSRQNNYSTTNFNSSQPFNQNQNYNNYYYENDSNKTSDVSQSYNQNFANRNLTNQQNSNRRPAVNEGVGLPEKKLKTEENTNKVEKRNEETAEQNKQQVPSNNAINDDEDDEEMRLYRLKIEEQKREREKVLKMKEERRKMMLQQQKKEDESVAPVPVKQGPAMTVNVQNKNYKPIGTLTVPQQQRSSTAAVPQQQRSLAAVPQQQRSSAAVPQQQRAHYHQQPVNRIPVLTTNKSHYFSTDNAQSSLEEEDELPNFTFRVSNDLQKTAPSSATVPKTEASSSSFMSNRVVVVKNSNSQKSGIPPNSSIVKTVAVSSEASKENSDVGQGLSSFFNNRKVLKKDNTLINTRLIVLSNLAASTTQNKLVAMTRGIGEIQKLQMDKQERQATILFRSVASAHAFFKKYQRHMLDLSVIEVKLEPMI